MTYPRELELKENIISNNLRLLTGNLPSYDKQIIKAIKRNDLISVNHRTAAYMESYFDIIFAMNELTHPGEKRMLQVALEKAAKLPEAFEENIFTLYQDIFSDTDRVENDILLITGKLKDCLNTLQYKTDF